MKNNTGLCLIAIAIVVLGFCLKSGIRHFVDSDRIITVKGLAEKEVEANEVIWPLVYKQASNDLSFIYNNVEEANKKIVNFLRANEIPESDISIATLSVLDGDAERYSNPDQKYRYKATSVITVASKDVAKVKELMTRQGELIKYGIALSTDDYQYQPVFSYTDLNEIKPQMIEEATKNARDAAEKFAKDSDSEIGKIRTANQGQFTILDRDNNTPHIKRIRVVTTIQYLLKD